MPTSGSGRILQQRTGRRQHSASEGGPIGSGFSPTGRTYGSRRIGVPDLDPDLVEAASSRGVVQGQGDRGGLPIPSIRQGGVEGRGKAVRVLQPPLADGPHEADGLTGGIVDRCSQRKACPLVDRRRILAVDRRLGTISRVKRGLLHRPCRLPCSGAVLIRCARTRDGGRACRGGGGVDGAGGIARNVRSCRAGGCLTIDHTGIHWRTASGRHRCRQRARLRVPNSHHYLV